MMKKTLICIDRDGTLIHDTREHLFLGRDNDWQEQVGILPHVVEGLRLLNTIAGVGIYMITNQAGVAISDFPLLTEERAHEVCRYVVAVLKGEGANLAGHFLCPHATPEYAARKPDIRFHAHLVHDCHCLKPGLGMVFDALQAEGITPDNADLYVIGDRASDVRTALNLDGIGVLIPFVNEPGESDKVAEMAQQGQVHVAQDMLAAAEFIVSRVRR
jgi:histidinol-phosphate phosphatase family protein